MILWKKNVDTLCINLRVSLYNKGMKSDMSETETTKHVNVPKKKIVY